MTTQPYGPARLDLYLTQGDVLDETFTLTDLTTGQLLNLTGYTGVMTVKDTFGNAVTILDINTTNSKMTLGGAAGTVRVQATKDQTAAITVDPSTAMPPRRSCVWDLWLTDASGNPVRYMYGIFNVSAKV